MKWTLLALLLPHSPSSVIAATPEPTVSATETIKEPLRLWADNELPDFKDSFPSKKGLIAAAKKTLIYLDKYTGPKYFRIGNRDYSHAILADSIKELLVAISTSTTDEQLASHVKEKFDVFQSIGNDGLGKVVFSSYYQPMLPASAKKAPKYPYPLYRKPHDMVALEMGEFDAKQKGTLLIGRVNKNKQFVPYFTRGEIDIRKALAGKNLEIAWLRDKFDALDLHIQGSGILKFPSGKEMLARYAATNAHAYNSVGLLLVKANIFNKNEITHDKVREYLHTHPEANDWILAQNPRYTFFELVPLPADGEPFGTIQESLTPSRSIAIDPAIIPLGALAFFTTVSPQADKAGRLLGQFPNSRFALCMDTGGAIKGPGRVDIYVGHGKQAETTARNQWNEGKLYILIKKIPQRER